MKKKVYSGLLGVLILSLVLIQVVLNAQVTMDKQGKSPVAMKFQPGNQPTVATFFQDYRKAYPLSEENQMKELRISSDKTGSHYRYDQYYKGIQVIGAQYILHEKNGGVWFANGHLVHGLELDVNPVLTKDQALQLALQNVNAAEYMWEKPGNESMLKKILNDEHATYYPSGELKLTSGYESLSSENVKLVWRFDIYAMQPLGRYWVDVNARTGDIVYKENRLYPGDVPGSGESLYYGPVNVTVDEVDPGVLYRLHEYTTRPVTIQTYNLQNYWDYDHFVDFTAETADGEWDAVGVTVHHGVESTYDYFAATFGRNSYDDNGGPLFSFAHYGTGYDNAFWDGYVMTFGDGDGYWDGPLVSYDVVAHELTHGVTQYSSNLTYYCESGALNESFSDIFGNLVEFYKKGLPGVGNGDWHIGEDFSLQGMGFRNMADPKEFMNPDTYLGEYWFPSNGGDGGGVHTNSGVQNYWFYLLVEGGSGINDNGDVYDVAGIGVDDAATIAYLNNNSFLTPISNYLDARFGSITIAESLFGVGSPQALAVADAWDAVGVYDFQPPENDLCADAIELFCNDVVYGTTIGATFDPEAPWCDYEHSAGGVWYKFAGNDHTMFASMCDGPVWDSRITIYEGSCANLVCVAADDDGCGGYSTVSKVAWFASAGTDYYILVHGYLGCVGNFGLSLTSLDAAIATDPDEFNFQVPFNGNDADQLTISSPAQDCMKNLNWYAYNTEPELPLSRSLYNPQAKSSTGVKPDFQGTHDISRNTVQKGIIIPSGPPVLISGNVNSSGKTGERAQNSEEKTVTITHSLDQSILPYNSVICWDGNVSLDNGYWRAFKLPEFGIFSDFNVMNVEIALEVAIIVNSDLQLTVNLFTSEGKPFPMGDLNFIGSATYQIAEQAYCMLSLPVIATAPAGSELVVEIFSPGGNLFVIGTNNLGQTGPSYLSADACGLLTPVDMADIGFPDVHIVMNVTGSYEEHCPWLSVSPYEGIIPPGSSDDVTVNVDASGMAPGTYECQLTIRSNATTGPVIVPVTMTVVDVTPPVITAAGPIALWPPNHKYENLDLSELVISVVDDVDGTIPVSNVVIESASSDEPDNIPGNSDGNTINDMVIASDCKSVDLRQERQDNANGRVYLVQLSVADEAGNVSFATCMVNVPHDEYHVAIDDGPDHSVACGLETSPLLTGIENNIQGKTELVNYPNPFDRTTTIQFTVENSNNTKLIIYNSLGTEVTTLYSSMAEAGHRYTLIFNGKNLPEGVYFCRLQSGENVNIVSKMLLIK